LLSGKPPLIYEDGYQRRDFVSVADVVQACRLALEVPEAAGQVFNVGSGQHYTVGTIAWRIAALLGNRMPDREARVEAFFFHAASEAPECRFLLGGNGWDSKPMPVNVTSIGHVYTYDHNAFNCSPRVILNINRASMARYGFSPPTRIFEAAGVGAGLITDAWEGIECFLEPEHEVIIVHDGSQLAKRLRVLTPARACAIGAAARRRLLAEHTYRHRAEQFAALLTP
jgi:spore maturation protein CgeB